MHTVACRLGGVHLCDRRAPAACRRATLAAYTHISLHTNAMVHACQRVQRAGAVHSRQPHQQGTPPLAWSKLCFSP